MEQWSFNIRAPRDLVKAFDRVCEQRDTARSADLLDHMRRTVKRHGDEEALALLAKADAVLAQPRKAPRVRRRKNSGDSPQEGTAQ